MMSLGVAHGLPSQYVFKYRQSRCTSHRGLIFSLIGPRNFNLTMAPIQRLKRSTAPSEVHSHASTSASAAQPSTWSVLTTVGGAIWATYMVFESAGRIWNSIQMKLDEKCRKDLAKARVGRRLELPKKATTECGNILLEDLKPISLSKSKLSLRAFDSSSDGEIGPSAISLSPHCH
jgi:hypothetical protein